MFTQKGMLVIENNGLDEEQVMDDCFEAGAADFNYGDEAVEIVTEPSDLGKVREALEAKGYSFASAEVEYVPATYTSIEDEDMMKKMALLLDGKAAGCAGRRRRCPECLAQLGKRGRLRGVKWFRCQNDIAIRPVEAGLFAISAVRWPLQAEDALVWQKDDSGRNCANPKYTRNTRELRAKKQWSFA